MNDRETDRLIDLRDQACPMTFVRTRLALESMAAGQTLLVLLDGAESQARVPLAVRQQGHLVLGDTIDAAGTMRLLVRKAGQASPSATPPVDASASNGR